jgi:arylsulfatase A
MKKTIKRGLLLVIILLIARISLFAQTSKLPNFIIIFADDMGYGDLSCFGHPTIRTPNLDQMAVEGMRFTQFYVAANVCSPSRAALLTGRLPVRCGVYPWVFYPYSASGLPLSEITIAEALKTKGYETALIGKWHLGTLPEYLPMAQGFDYYFGIPYSGDMGKVSANGRENDMYPPLPLYLNHEVIEEGPDQRLLTKRYTEKALEFIRANKDKPFFLYYPNNFPHTPLYVSDDFSGTSSRGLYGDVVQELDWSVGEILNELKALGLDENTFVIFTSDNGPWLSMGENGGSAGLLYQGKGTTYEGGMREPMIAWWPGKVPANTISEALASSMDIFPTFCALAGIDVSTDRPYDGMDIQGLFFGNKKSVRDVIYYYNSDRLFAIRKGPWKAHFVTSQETFSGVPSGEHNPPLLFNLDVDPSEKYEVGADHPDVIEELTDLYNMQLSNVIPAESETRKVIEGQKFPFSF